jgi:hypothetical protein
MIVRWPLAVTMTVDEAVACVTLRTQRRVSTPASDSSAMQCVPGTSFPTLVISTNGQLRSIPRERREKATAEFAALPPPAMIVFLAMFLVSSRGYVSTKVEKSRHTMPTLTTCAARVEACLCARQDRTLSQR